MVVNQIHLKKTSARFVSQLLIKMKINEQKYLGDGLYVSFDGYQFALSAENGIVATDTVFLEPDVLKAFIKFTKEKFTV